MGKYVMKMPDVGEGVVEAEVVEWLVTPGDVVGEDQHIVDVMTDKATMEITSPVSGKVVAVYGDPGDMLAVGAELIEFSTETESREDISNQTIEVACTEDSPALALVAPESPRVAASSRSSVADVQSGEIEIPSM